MSCKVKTEKETGGKKRAIHRNMLLPCDNPLDSFNWNIEAELTNSRKQEDRKEITTEEAR